MKKSLLLAMCLLVGLLVNAQKPKIYLQPITHSCDISTATNNRVQNAIVYGMSNARTIIMTKGDKKLDAKTLKAQGYDLALQMDIKKCEVKRTDPLFGMKSTASDGKTNQADIELSVKATKLTDNVQDISAMTLSGLGTNDKSEDVALLQASYDFMTSAKQYVDDNIPVYAFFIDGTEQSNEDGEVKNAIVNVGSARGIRKGLMFRVYKVGAGDKVEELGKARAEQVLSATETLVYVYGRKDGDKKIFSALQNSDGTTKIMLQSRSEAYFGVLGDQLSQIVSGHEEKGETYPAQIGRTVKPTIGLIKASLMDNSSSSGDLDKFLDSAMSGVLDCSTVKVGDVTGDLATARQKGYPAAIELALDHIDIASNAKDGKTTYTATVDASACAVDVNTGAWINMRLFQRTGSDEDKEKAKANAFSNLKTDYRKFLEDVFPVAGLLTDEVEAKKDKVQAGWINIGSNLGVQKGMMFDIYKQLKDVGEDSREFLGTGKVTKDVEANRAYIKVKGSKNGDEKIYQLLQNSTDDNVQIVVVSRAKIDRVSTFLDGVKSVKEGLGGIFK